MITSIELLGKKIKFTVTLYMFKKQRQMYKMIIFFRAEFHQHVLQVLRLQQALPACVAAAGTLQQISPLPVHLSQGRERALREIGGRVRAAAQSGVARDPWAGARRQAGDLDWNPSSATDHYVMWGPGIFPGPGLGASNKSNFAEACGKMWLVTRPGTQNRGGTDNECDKVRVSLIKYDFVVRTNWISAVY